MKRTIPPKVTTTPKKAVHEFCRQCVSGQKEVRNCGGNKMLSGQGLNGKCLFFDHRLADQKAAKLKTIKLFCRECMGGILDTDEGMSGGKINQAVKECPTINCPIYTYRNGKNPNRKRRG